jgi:undecaprenyl-diphosphatase
MKSFTNLDTHFSHRLIVSPQSNWQSLVGKVAHLGDGQRVLGGIIALYLAGWLWEDNQLCQVVLITILAIVLTGAIVTMIKFMVRRSRPKPPGEFVLFDYDRYSFPSGHSARVAALATGIMLSYPLIGGCLMILALSIAIARVGVGVHYLSDILAGFTIGVVVTEMMVSYM